MFYGSDDLDVYTIMSIIELAEKIAAWGVGTKAITAFDQPALGAVYKLVSIEDENGQMRDTIKISASPEKVTTPGLKKVYRIINNLTNKSEGDYITLAYEQPEKETKLHMFHPVHTYIGKFATNLQPKTCMKIFSIMVNLCMNVRPFTRFSRMQISN